MQRLAVHNTERHGEKNLVVFIKTPLTTEVVQQLSIAFVGDNDLHLIVESV